MLPKTILITGSTTGIGLAGARALAAQGWKVLVHARTAPKGQQALETLGRQVPAGQFELVTGDLSDLDQVKSLAAQVKQKAPVLDVLWSNAGLMTNDPSTSTQGFELQWAVNHLAPFVLLRELAPLVQASRGRLIQTSSLYHHFGRVPGPQGFDLPSGRYDGMATYGSTKLANVLMIQGWANRLEGTGVFTAAFHPGYVKTTIGSNGKPDRGNAATPFLNLFQIPVDQGAETGVILSASDPVPGPTGRYWSSRKVRRGSGRATPAASQALWSLTEAELKARWGG